MENEDSVSLTINGEKDIVLIALSILVAFEVNISHSEDSFHDLTKDELVTRALAMTEQLRLIQSLRMCSSVQNQIPENRMLEAKEQLDRLTENIAEHKKEAECKQ